MSATKTCIRCLLDKSTTEFRKKAQATDGLSPYCKICVKSIDRASYLKHHERRRDVNVVYRMSERGRDRCAAGKKAHVRRRRAMIASVKDVPCMDCGGRFPSVCMDFDHRDPSKKSFTISMRAIIGLDALMSEMEKCDIVCANCHRIRTFKKKPQVHRVSTGEVDQHLPRVSKTMDLRVEPVCGSGQV